MPLSLKSALTLVSTALILSACGGNPSPQPQPKPQPQPETFTADPGVIHGQIQPWSSRWANTVAPVNSVIENPGPVGSSSAFTAQVNEQGKFDLVLPNPSVMNTTYKSDLMTVKDAFAGCSTLDVTGASETLRIAQINELRTDTGKALTVTSDGGTTFKTWWYANEDATVTINGSDCIGIGATNSTVNLKAGWNVIEQKVVSPATNTLVTSYTNTTAPTTRTVWTEQGTALAQQGLSANFLRPWIKASTTTR